MNAMRSMNTIETFLKAVGSIKHAEANLEPGSIGGATSHPVKDVDDSTEDAKEGERSSENTSDVKADQGKASVENTKDNVAVKAAAMQRRAKKADDGKSTSGDVNPPGTAASDQLQIGTVKAPTGDQPEVETSSVKEDKEDSDSTHPARTDNDELDGEKYASMSLEKLASYTDRLGNQLLAMIANGIEDAPSTKSAAAIEKESADLSGQAGWELAGLFSGDFDKQAADALVTSTLEAMIKTASDDADNVVDYLQKQAQAKRAATGRRTKRAGDPMAGGMDPAMAGGMDPAMAGGDPAAMGGGDPAAMGGMDPAMAGGDPAMGGGMPPEEGGGGGGDDVQQLVEIMQQLGITVDDIAAAMGEGGGEAPPEAGAEEAAASPIKDEAASAPGMEVEASDRGRTKTSAAKQGNAAVDMTRYIQEIVSRSRRS